MSAFSRGALCEAVAEALFDSKVTGAYLADLETSERIFQVLQRLRGLGLEWRVSCPLDVGYVVDVYLAPDNKVSMGCQVASDLDRAVMSVALQALKTQKGGG